jgi:hypothetical protein
MERLKLRALYLVGLTVIVVAATLMVHNPATAQAPVPVSGPPGGLGVQVLGGSVQVSGGTVQVGGGTIGVTDTVAATQSGPWTVNVAAQNVFTETVHPTCPFTNVCRSIFSAVPAGRVLRVTAIMGFLRFQERAGFLALHADSLSAGRVLFAAPLPLEPGNYYGNMLTFNMATDVVFTGRPLSGAGDRQRSGRRRHQRQSHQHHGHDQSRFLGRVLDTVM